MKAPGADFFVSRNDIREPYEVALDWLLAQNLKPGDEIYQNEISSALGLIDPNTLRTRSLIRKWELARMPQVEQLLAAFEEQTGLITWPSYRNTYLILAPDEVASTLLTATVRRVIRAWKTCLTKIGRADPNTASVDELIRRADVRRIANNNLDFMQRQRRVSLDDQPSETS